MWVFKINSVRFKLWDGIFIGTVVTLTVMSGLRCHSARMKPTEKTVHCFRTSHPLISTWGSTCMCEVLHPGQKKSEL